MCLQIGFLIFWQKDFGTKAAHKMLVKLTPGGLTIISMIETAIMKKVLFHNFIKNNNWKKKKY